MLSYLKQEVVDYLSVFLLKVLPEVSILPSLVAINIIKVEIKMPCDLALVTWSKAHVDLSVGVSHSKSISHQVGCL